MDRSIQNPVSTIENNVRIMLTMLEYARAHPPETFLLFSTDEVYGDSSPLVDETQALRPSNPYAASKAAQEMISIAYWRTYRVPVIITNSSNVVGSGQDPEKFIPKIIRAIKAGETIKVHAANGVVGMRYWNPVQNVVTALDVALEAGPTFKSHGPNRYHLPGGEEHSNLDVARMVAAALSMTLDYEVMEVGDLRPGYDQRYPKIEGKELIELGWTPAITLKECIDRLVRDS